MIARTLPEAAGGGRGSLHTHTHKKARFFASSVYTVFLMFIINKSYIAYHFICWDTEHVEVHNYIVLLL